MNTRYIHSTVEYGICRFFSILTLKLQSECYRKGGSHDTASVVVSTDVVYALLPLLGVATFHHNIICRLTLLYMPHSHVQYQF